MATAIADQVVEFFDDLFGRTFSEVFRPNIRDVLRRKAVVRQVEEAADAASQSLTRFFRNQQLSEQQAADILEGFAPLSSTLTLEQISNPNIHHKKVRKRTDIRQERKTDWQENTPTEEAMNDQLGKVSPAFEAFLAHSEPNEKRDAIVIYQAPHQESRVRGASVS